MTFAKWLQSLKNVEKGELLFFSPTSLGTYLSNTKPGNWWVRSFCPWICICFPLSLPRQRRAEGRNQHNFHWPGSKYAYDILLTFTLPFQIYPWLGICSWLHQVSCTSIAIHAACFMLAAWMIYKWGGNLWTTAALTHAHSNSQLLKHRFLGVGREERCLQYDQVSRWDMFMT